MFKRLLKKILLTVLTLAVLAGLVVGIRYLNASRDKAVGLYSKEEAAAPLDTLTDIQKSGLQLVEENDQLELWVNFDDGNIQVVNKENGYVWRSCPTEEDMALESSNKLWTNNLKAPIMFTYVQETSAANTKYSNTLTEEAEVTVYQMDKGVRVYFALKAHAVTLAYDAYLDGSSVVVSMPSYLISDPGEVYKTSKSGKVSLDKDASMIIAEIYLFPSLGAARSDTGMEGALLVPDGTGALIDFQSHKYVNSQYIAPVYGSDLALANGYDSSLRSLMNSSVVAFPAYGVIREGNTMLAVIDQGETQADVAASRAGVQTGFNTVSVRYTYRMKYKVITNSTTGDGYLNYTSFAVKEPRRVIYTFGTGDYVDMAGQYRSYLMDRYDLHRIDPAKEPAALQLNLVGGDIESGILGSSYVTTTSFSQAEEMLRWFSDQGVDAMDVTYTGWAKRGESVQYPDRFPVSGELGGGAGLSALTKAAEELGARIYLLDDHLTLASSLGVSIGKSTVYNIQGNPLFSGAFANSSFMASSYVKDLKQYLQLGVSGLQEAGAGSMLMTDYAADHAMARSEVMEKQRELLQQMANDFGSVRVASSNAYALMDHAVITELAASSNLTMLDESVPFYSIALHGLVDYLCGDYMAYYEPQKQLLDAIAQGGSVSFTLTHEGTELLARTDSAMYYSTAYDLWREDVLSLYHKLTPYLEATRGQFITGHEVLRNGVTLTTYENGVQVLVNNTDSAYPWQGAEVAPRDFLVLKGV